MSVYKRIQDVFLGAKEIPFDHQSKIVIMSDCHRGTGSGADNFSKNQNLYYVALTHYLREGYVYVELGDGDELWENADFGEISQEYGHIFALLSQLYQNGRMYMVYGNHDMQKKYAKWTKCNLSGYCGHYEGKTAPLFPEIQIHEGLVLRHRETQRKILLLHGHQADFFNDKLWRLGKFLVRYIWRPLELVGVRDPTSTSRNDKRRKKVEQHLIDWCDSDNVMLIAGHTHRPVFPKAGDPLYFNDGSCVHRRFITCIEIQNSMISLVNWSIQPRQDSVLYVKREILEGPVPIEDYFTKTVKK